MATDPAPAEVLVAGALHLDVVVTAPALPRPDETVVGRTVSYPVGGKGANQALAARRMGARTAMAGLVGEDDFGARLLAGLAAGGVDAGQVRRHPGPSGMSVAIVDDSGTYGAVIVSGVNRLMDAGMVTFPKGMTTLLLQNEIPEAVNRALAARARTAGCRVILNAAPMRPTAPALIALADVLVVNRVEAADLAGVPLAGLEPAAVAAALVELGADTAIVTLGADGLVVAGRGMRPLALPAFPVAVISTHGAGDAFVGALAAALSAGRELSEALRFAQAAAALAVAAEPGARARVTAADALRLAGMAAL